MLVQGSERCSTAVEALCADPRTVIAGECTTVGVVNVIAEAVLTWRGYTAFKLASGGDPGGGVVKERGPCFCFHESSILQFGGQWGVWWTVGQLSQGLEGVGTSSCRHSPNSHRLRISRNEALDVSEFCRVFAPPLVKSRTPRCWLNGVCH